MWETLESIKLGYKAFWHELFFADEHVENAREEEHEALEEKESKKLSETFQMRAKS